MSQKKIQFISYGPTLGTAETQPTDWVWPPALHHCLDNINRQRRVYFCGEFLGPLHFLRFFHSYITFFSFNLLRSQRGNGKISAHRLNLASFPAPPPGQHQWAVACLFWRLDFISFTIFANVSFTTSYNLFNNILSVLWQERWTLSPQTEFGLPPCTTTLPTSMGSGGFILTVRFNFLPQFHSFFFYYIWYFFN